MKIRRIATALVSVACLLAIAACTSIPPTYVTKPPRRGISPRSYKMKLAVFNFVDQTGSAGKLIETMPDILATELFSTKRFELKERAELREVDPSQMDKIRDKYKYEVDTFIVGAITRFSVEDKTMTLDVRAFNAYNGTVMYAGHHDVHYQGVLDVKAERKDIEAIAEALYRAFPKLGGIDSKVVSLSGEYVTINLGEKDGAKIGMGALVIAGGDTIKDPVSHETLAHEIYVGEVYIVEVKEKTSKAVITKPGSHSVEEPSVRLHDGIQFK